MENPIEEVDSKDNTVDQLEALAATPDVPEDGYRHHYVKHSSEKKQVHYPYRGLRQDGSQSLQNLSSEYYNTHLQSKKSGTAAAPLDIRSTANCSTSFGQRRRSPPATANTSMNKSSNGGVRKYNATKKSIVDNMNSKQYWPKGMTHPDEYRVFYWAPDMSFCGFAANHIFKKTKAQAKELKMPTLIKKSQH